ncbi:hypothetical protein BC831DRAFT_517032 [Entophlyctis helioformis]|nr:hypothetical protein BC831DRAFT_517032 [Entophlyctis helioformis]
MFTVWSLALLTFVGLYVWRSVQSLVNIEARMRTVESNLFDWPQASSVAIKIRGGASGRVTVRQAAASEVNATSAVFSYDLRYSEDTPIDASKVEVSFANGSATLLITTASLPIFSFNFVYLFNKRLDLIGSLVLPAGANTKLFDLDIDTGASNIVLSPVATRFGSIRLATGAGYINGVDNGQLTAQSMTLATNAGDVSAGSLAVGGNASIRSGAGDIRVAGLSVNGSSVDVMSNAGDVRCVVKGYTRLQARSGAGSVNLVVDPQQGSQTTADSNAGSINVDVAAGFLGTFTAKSNAGSVEARGGQVRIDSQSQSQVGGRVGDSNNGGSPSTIDASTGAGNVRLSFN